MSENKLQVINNVFFSVRKLLTLLYISFSSIFSTFGKKGIGRYFQKPNLEPFWKTSITLAVLSINENEPDKKRLNKSASCLKISFLRRIKILFRILNRPLASLMSREDMMLLIFPFYVG